MIEWIIIVVLIILILVFFRMRHFKHRIYAVLLILLILFFYLSVSKIIANQNLNLKSFDGIMAAGKIYLSWLWHAIINVKDIAGNVIKDAKIKDWAGNSTS